MKIKHLLEYVFPKIQRVNVPTERLPGQRGKLKPIGGELEQMGKGSFSKVWHNPQQTPHDVRKISTPVSLRSVDGFYYYVLELEKHSDNTNPYFPMFRGIKIYTSLVDGVERITYSVQMEKLTPISNLTDSELDAMLYKLFGDNINEKTGAFIKQTAADYIDINDNIINGVVNVIASGLLGEYEETEQVLKLVVDKDFLKAMKFILTVQKKHMLGIDLQNSENIMIRRTSVGAQLVITDPVA